MLKILQIVVKRLSLVFLISVVFFSFPQQVLQSTDYSILVTTVAAVPPSNLTLSFSTFFGGSDKDQGHGLAVTKERYCYVTGLTKSSDFPTKNAFNSTYSGDYDAFITKFAADGSILWSTYLGGSNHDICLDIAVADDDSCYVIGETNSSDFPTKNAYDSTHNGGYLDVFVAKFSSNGSLLWSTYLGGSDSDYALGIAVADDGSCYVTGETQSSNFPTKKAYDSTFNGWYFDVFVAKFSAAGALLWSTYLGGGGNEGGYSISVTSDGSCYVTGLTASTDFPTQNAYDNTQNGDWDVFITKFSTQGSLLWSTFFGGAWWDEAYGIVAASDGSCYVTGYTGSSDFPQLNAFNSTIGDWGDAFVAKFAANGSLLWSTFLGGNGVDRGRDIVTTIDGSCYVTGNTGSTNFPTKNAYDNTYNGVYDVFVSKFDTNGLLLWSTFLGGSSLDQGHDIAVTEDGYCYVTGTTHSTDFPTQNALDHTLGAMSDIFVTAFIEPLQPSTQNKILYGFLAFIAITLLIVLILYMKRK